MRLCAEQMADKVCVVCERDICVADMDVCTGCMAKMPSAVQRTMCAVGHCPNPVIAKSEMCIFHIIGKVYEVYPPYTDSRCNVKNCRNPQFVGLPICAEHWESACAACSPTSMKQPQKPVSVPKKLCRCGKEADPHGNMCFECFERFNATKFRKCRCGGQLGAKGNMCAECFSKFKQEKFGETTSKAVPVHETVLKPVPKPVTAAAAAPSPAPFAHPAFPMVHPMGFPFAAPPMAYPQMHPMMRQCMPPGMVFMPLTSACPLPTGGSTRVAPKTPEKPKHQ